MSMNYKEVPRGLPELEAFLEGRRVQTIEIGGKSPRQLEDELVAAHINITPSTRNMLHHETFTVEETPKSLVLVWVQLRDLGFTRATTKQIFERVGEMPFLKKCPAEVGPHLRLIDKDQPLNTWYYVGMNTIPGRDGDPGVFSLERGRFGLWLCHIWVPPDYMWRPRDEFVFSLRKDETPKS